MNNSLSQKDAQFVWHPFTSLESAISPILIESAKGAYLYTIDGKKIIDAVSSWWVNIHGHSHPVLAKALYDQALTMEHVIFAGFTHAPAIEFAEKILAILPGDQQKVFYSDNGSTAVEVAIKMAFQYWVNLGVKKTKIIALQGAYHGDTFGAMSVGERSTFTQAFSPFLFNVNFLKFPCDGFEENTLKEFDALTAAEDVAVFIYEPLLQGAAGMRTYSPEILEILLQRAKAKNIICIADEVLTGFGRTGKYFASEYLKTAPDIIALSKGITGGTMPMGVTTCNQKIISGFQSADKEKTFYHGHSYTANPLGCAVALASLDLFLNAECQENIKRIENRHNDFSKVIASNKNVEKVCLLGTIISIELKTGDESSYFNKKRDYLYNFFLDRNILLRPLGNVIYILPPYIISDNDLDEIYHAILELLEEF